MKYHNPVLLKRSVDGLEIKPSGIYVDVTFGGGGHSKEILNRLGSQGRLIAFDQDIDAQRNSIDDKRFLLIPENFRYIKRFLKFNNITKVDGILADLGVSSHQFDEASRGFSTRFDADLDMRMNTNDLVSAYEVVNTYNEKQLADIFHFYGELRSSKMLSKAILDARKEHAIKTIFDLKKVIAPFVPNAKQHKVLAQIFQAIRIEVNQEIDALKEFLIQTPTVLNEKGRLSVISYHSLEDRLVKRFIRNGVFEGEPEKDIFGRFETPFKSVGKMIIPDAEEIKNNSRARSAKLRIAVKS